MESVDDQVRAFLLALGLHVLIVLLLWFGLDWLLPAREAVAAGEPVQATLQVSDAARRQASAAIAKAEQAQEAAPPPQPVPEPRPQQSPTPPQPVPQRQLDRPDTVDQQAVSRSGELPPPAPAPKEQERRQRQEQADLTEDIARQQEVERRQRLLAYQDVQREREAATRRANMEAQRMQQLSDLQAEAPRAPAAAAPAGNRGQEDDLRTRYVAALQQAADQNWNHLGAPELTACKVRFTQIRGGEVINVEFIACPYDVQGREFVERALRKGMMPYAGFESVFERQVSLTFCYPREDCQR